MKRFILSAICAMFTFAMVSAQEAKTDKKNTTTKFYIENMSCDHCIQTIEKNIAFEKGVTDLKCDLKTKTVTVTYKNDKTSDAKLVTAFGKIKYKASVVKEEKKADK